MEQNLVEKKNEVQLLEKELKIQAKKEVVIEEKLVTFGKSKMTKREKGNLVITRKEYDKLFLSLDNTLLKEQISDLKS